MPGFRERFGSDADDLLWQDYEELVKDIYQALGKASGVTIECWGSGCRVRGRSEVLHQIDVLTSHWAGPHQYRTGISCKHWKKKVRKKDAMEFAEIVEDTGLNKGVIVSKMGFTHPAKTYAKFKNIGLVELRKPVDQDWDGAIREVHVTLTVDMPPTVENASFRLAGPEPSDGEGPTPWLVGPALVCVPGHEEKTFYDLALEQHASRPDRGDHDIAFPEGSRLKVPDHPGCPTQGFALKGVSFTVTNTPPMSTEFAVRANDHIYMIMESLFEGRRFTITTDGEIVEDAS